MFKNISNLLPSFNDNKLFYLFLALLIFIPLYPKFPLANIAGTYVAIRLEDVLLSIVVGTIFVSNLKNIKELISQNIVKSFIAFFIIGLLTVISGVFITFTVTPHIGLLHLFRRVEYMSLFIAAILVFKNQQQVRFFLYTMFVVSLIVILYGLGQVYLGFGVISTVNKDLSKGVIVQLTSGSRLNSTFAGHYDLAIFMSFILVFLGTYFFYFRKYWQKITILIISGFSLFVLALTAARVSFLATLLGVASAFWFTGKKLLIILLVILSITAVALVPNLRDRFVATLTVNILQQDGGRYTPTASDTPKISTLQEDLKSQTKKKALSYEANQEQFSTKSAGLPVDIAPGEPTDYTELEVSRSLDIRLEVEWPRTIAAFFKNPFLGTGYSSLTLATDNDYLRSLGETGLLGTLSLFLIFFILVKRFQETRTNNKSFVNSFMIGCLGVIIVVAITGTFLDILEASKVASLLWATLGVGWAISEKNEA